MEGCDQKLTSIDIRKYTVPDFQGRDTTEAVVHKIREILDNIKKKGIVYINRRDCVTGYACHELYDWDLYFECLFLSHFGVAKYCRNNVETFLDLQKENGYVSRAAVNLRESQHFKPFLAQTALLGSRQLQDFRWLRGERYYQRLKKYLDYWFSCDSDNNGLCFWDGSDHSGMDNQARRLGYYNVKEYEGVDLNCYLVRELRAMAEIAREIGREEDAKEFDDHAAALRDKINEVFWDDADGFYYDRSEKTGQLNKVKSIAGFMPLWADVAPADRAERLVKEHLLNKNEFWQNYPVATWSMSEPDFHQEKLGNESSWMGSTWIPTNYMVFRGIIDYGYLEAAKELADKSFELVVSEQDLREYYNGETGAGQGLSPFWGWSSLGYIMKAEVECGFSNSDIYNKEFVTLDGFTL